MGEVPFPTNFTPGRDVSTDDPRLSRPWLRDRHHPLLGRHVPRVNVPQWPAMHVEPGYALNKQLPTHFKAYTETKDGSLWADVGETWEQAKYNLRLRVEDAGW